MTIGFSPFLTADVDESFGLATHWAPAGNTSISTDVAAARIELIRRRVVMGYYSSAAMATETARRLLDARIPDES
jgi:hypothetical protein